MMANRDNNLFIGLMSGTSADGIDAALIRFTDDQPPSTVETLDYPLPSRLRKSLLALNTNPCISLRELSLLDTQIAEAHATAVQKLLAKAAIGAEQVTAIGFHGQTIDHAPSAPESNSTQLGNSHLLAATTGIRVIGDVRRADIAAGGEGAPLAPALHAELLRRGGTDTAVANIGGIANLSLLPAEPQQDVLGFDTGPGNCLMDEWASIHLGKRFDENGEFAQSGRTIEPLLSEMLSTPFFSQDIPKSTGRDLFNTDWLIPLIDEKNHQPKDVQATLAELTAKTIAAHLTRYAPNTTELFICGGGARNGFLMDLLRRELPQTMVESTAARGIEPDWMEAILMAWLARQHCLNKPGNLPSVTGAKYSVRLGVSYEPPATRL